MTFSGANTLDFAQNKVDCVPCFGECDLRYIHASYALSLASQKPVVCCQHRPEFAFEEMKDC